MSATEERDLTQDIQVRSDNVVDHDPGLISAPVGTAEGLDGKVVLSLLRAKKRIVRWLSPRARS